MADCIHLVANVAQFAVEAIERHDSPVGVFHVEIQAVHAVHHLPHYVRVWPGLFKKGLLHFLSCTHFHIGLWAKYSTNRGVKTSICRDVYLSGVMAKIITLLTVYFA